jgi:ABC-type transporter Mla subunit MlaD
MAEQDLFPFDESGADIMAAVEEMVSRKTDLVRSLRLARQTASRLQKQLESTELDDAINAIDEYLHAVSDTLDKARDVAAELPPLERHYRAEYRRLLALRRRDPDAEYALPGLSEQYGGVAVKLAQLGQEFDDSVLESTAREEGLSKLAELAECTGSEPLRALHEQYASVLDLELDGVDWQALAEAVQGLDERLEEQVEDYLD